MIQVQYISNAAIDRVLWDNCIKNSTSNLIYGQSIYLDAMAENWDAIIVNNYEAVIPLPYKKKWGIKYLYMPAFIQQLGLFTTNKNIVFSDVLPLLKANFKYVDLCLNFSNSGIEKSIAKTNFVLPMSNNYNFYAENYKSDLKKNLKKSNKENLLYQKNTDLEIAIALYKTNYKDRHKSITNKDYSNFEQLCTKLKIVDKVFTRAVYNSANEILAIALFLFDGKRMYNVMNTTTSGGKIVAANHFLFDKIIEEFAGSNYILDFEGSDLPGVKSFYEKFCPLDEPYFYLKINNLHPILKLLKK